MKKEKKSEVVTRKKIRHNNLKNNKNAYKKLQELMVPNEISLAKFRQFYHPVLSTKEKDILINIGIDPWSVEGLKYAGDCKRLNIKLGDKILN